MEAGAVTAAMKELSKSAWCRKHGLHPGDLDKWRVSCTTHRRTRKMRLPVDMRRTLDADRSTDILSSTLPDSGGVCLEAPQVNHGVLKAVAILLDGSLVDGVMIVET